MIKRPMKALGEPITDAQLEFIEYPIIGSPKIDGIRGLHKGQEGVFSASMKKCRNKHIQRSLLGDKYAGLDGELVVGKPYIEHEEDDVFYRSSGPIRSINQVFVFGFYVFDDFTETNKTYKYRWLDQLEEDNGLKELPHVHVLEYRILSCPQDVLDYEEECVNKGYEGIMLRNPKSLYKEGRTTLREGTAFKRKPIMDDEAIILECYEQTENTNEKITNEMGTSSRSGHKENKIPKNTLGGFVLKSNLWECTFRCGTIIGSTIASRKATWEQWKTNPESIIGTMVKYKFQKIGSIDRPRQPRICGIRDLDDMTDF